MKLSEAIKRLQDLHEELGDVPLVMQSEQVPSGIINIFRPVGIDPINVVAVECDKNRPHYVCLMDGNTSKAVWVY